MVPSVRLLRRAIVLATSVALVLVLAVLLAHGASASAKHHKKPRCPKGEVHTKTGCKTPLSKFLVTFRSSSDLIAAQLAPNGDGDSEIAWNPSVAYPYQHPCSGPPLPGVLATQTIGDVAPFKTKNSYVGTTFSGKKTIEGGAQETNSGLYTDSITVSTSGKVTSAKTIKGSVTITEKRGFGTSPTNAPIYTICGSTFSFTLSKYVGPFPGKATVPPSTP